MFDPIPIEEPKPKPKLPGTVVMRASADDLIDAMTADLLVHALSCVRSFGDFHLALSGGSTPMPFYRRLMYDPSCREFPWKKTHLWIVDERRVPFDDDRSNFKHIDELIVQHSDIPAVQVHPMLAMAEDADVQYEKMLHETLEWRERGQDRLDYVLLGMGGDAHTASLFPHSPAQLDGQPPHPARLVRINSGPKVTPPDRVTMTYPLLNAARFVAVMVTGESKKGTIERVVQATASAPKDGPAAEQIADMPILGIRPRAGELRWYLDEAACP